MRRGERRAGVGWNMGASRNWKGVRGMWIGSGDAEGREEKTQPRAWRRSADPEDDVEALLPCCTSENKELYTNASSYPPAAALALPQCGKCLCQDYSEEERSDRWEHLVGRAFSELFDARVF